MTETKKPSLSEALSKLDAIVEWFEDDGRKPNLEKDLEMAREGATLLRFASEQLGEFENQFKIVEADLKAIEEIATNVDQEEGGERDGGEDEGDIPF